ncbi:hypothetical protein OIDMADRAFT_59589 [Oidiodendron maius Zn]|uniref:Zn(2)-C6 fungal-type domain-containing protein n=1 Tax=Oidiodendron maius (strain Zn) TaxID=913774 RepID=A0A0C3D1M8_OIDMZ|nr:hypothetical protein OIDMADRAFT_59589 [Oidiodendron maius Zn]
MDSTDTGFKKAFEASVKLDAKGKSNAGKMKVPEKRVAKKRAAKACAACRVRKVRCDLLQRYHVSADGTVACSNCVMDGIRCVIQESKSRKKHPNNSQPAKATTALAEHPDMVEAQTWETSLLNYPEIMDTEYRRWNGLTTVSNDIANGDFLNENHLAYSIFQAANHQQSGAKIHKQQSNFTNEPNSVFSHNVATIHGSTSYAYLNPLLPISMAPMPSHKLPDYLKPAPAHMSYIDMSYLFDTGALYIPTTPARNALLQAYLEFVHPCMPLIETHEFLQIIDDGTGENGELSLLLFQSVMFAGTAFVGIEVLRSMGYSNRMAARKAFFQKVRILYDFDYEIDRIAVAQSLLLMTFWYETPDDQKNTWHWLGIAISVAYTIGLHRNPEKLNIELKKKKLRKRIWWSCFMRDRLVALGMMRPIRIQDDAYDVTMLTEEDFEISSTSHNVTIISSYCTLVRDVEAQRQLAQMCISKTKLCTCISHVLTAQHSFIILARGPQGQDGYSRPDAVPFLKLLDQASEVKRCDEELNTWAAKLPECCLYGEKVDPGTSGALVFLQRSLLHMVYFAAVSALHRPQLFFSGPITKRDKYQKLRDLSLKKVRLASKEITSMLQRLHENRLDRYLPTTGVMVLLPAVIVHLRDIKEGNGAARQTAMDGFY